MVDRIEQLVDQLAGRELVGDVCMLLDEHLERRDTAFLADFGAALHARYGSGAGGEHQYLFNRILWDVTTAPGRENVGHALRLGLATRSSSRRPVRRAAAVLAAHQSPQDLAPVFAPGTTYDAASDELRACLIHELVLRDAPIARLPEAVAWAAESPFWQDHPLSWLPWTLSPLEGTPSLPRYFRGGVGYGSGYGLPEGTRLPSRVSGSVPPVRGNMIDFALTTAVDRWDGRHNGRVESGIHVTDEPVDPGAVHPMLTSLALDCLADLAAPDHLTVTATSPAEAWRLLFAAASIGGGGEDYWWFGAYGRLAAWQSLAALSGAADGAPSAEVEQRAAECGWYGFDAATDWFNRDSMDFGLLTLTPDRRRIAVLAATDYNGG
ncbi:DUF6183 family protein [Kitasatospora aureofaciens]|uniref:DUF6183 family protein n=1 Tax=Kitasatospora aureofaciens TaxID=1894 RepID=UPI001C46B383|nr:DUF6183 family protein [Kitasatospora aureofaciens]MBV6699745.1 hypothetical protein [Kitasatospora aureofaciens]